MEEEILVLLQLCATIVFYTEKDFLKKQVKNHFQVFKITFFFFVPSLALFFWKFQI